MPLVSQTPATHLLVNRGSGAPTQPVTRKRNAQAALDYDEYPAKRRRDSATSNGNAGRTPDVIGHEDEPARKLHLGNTESLAAMRLALDRYAGFIRDAEGTTLDDVHLAIDRLAAIDAARFRRRCFIHHGSMNGRYDCCR